MSIINDPGFKTAAPSTETHSRREIRLPEAQRLQISIGERIAVGLKNIREKVTRRNIAIGVTGLSAIALGANTLIEGPVKDKDSSSLEVQALHDAKGLKGRLVLQPGVKVRNTPVIDNGIGNTSEDDTNNVYKKLEDPLTVENPLEVTDVGGDIFYGYLDTETGSYKWVSEKVLDQSKDDGSRYASLWVDMDSYSNQDGQEGRYLPTIVVPMDDGSLIVSSPEGIPLGVPTEPQS